MKRVISLVLLVSMLASLLCVGVQGAASEPALTVSSAAAKPGETVSVDIVMSGNPGIVSMGLDVGYDSDIMTLVKCTDGGLIGTAVHSDDLALNPYRLSWANDMATTNFTANGVIVTLEFKVSENAPAGDYAVTVSYTPDNFEIYDWEGNEYDFATYAGKVTVEGESAPEAEPALTVSSAAAKPGETVSVDIVMSGNPGIVSMGLDVGYDSDSMTLVKCTDGGLIGTAVHSDDLALNPYRLSWANDMATTNFTANGVIVTLEFKVSENAPAGDYAVTVSYTPDNFEIYDWEGNEYDFATNDGKISVEGATEPESETAVLQSANLTLEGQIGVNFYMTIPESLRDGYVLFTFKGAEKKIPVSNVTMDNQGRFKFTQLVAAKEMNDTINLKLLAPDDTPYAVTIPSGTPIPETGFNYAVKDYLKAAEQLDENTRDFAQKMASYGAYAQILLGYNAESAQGGDVSSVTKDTLAPYNYKLVGKMPDGLILKSMTLILESETSMRVYLNAADMAGYTVTIDGITVVPQKLGDAYYVQISNIAAKDLDKNHVLKFTNGTDTATLTVSGLTYGAMTLNQNEGQGTKTAECNVSKALYLYCMAAQKVVK